jgi:hypothetical protein
MCFYCFVLISHVIIKRKRWRTPGRSQCCLPLPPMHAMCLVWVAPMFSALSSSFQFLSESSEADNHRTATPPSPHAVVPLSPPPLLSHHHAATVPHVLLPRGAAFAPPRRAAPSTFPGESPVLLPHVPSSAPCVLPQSF